MLEGLFIKFTGFSWNEISCKLALLSLRHPCAVAIEKEFDSKKELFHGGIHEVLSYNTGRFGDFIVDTIDIDRVQIREMSREVGEIVSGRTRHRNDCCTRPGKTATMCSFCKIAYCDRCLRLVHYSYRKPCSWNGGVRPDCACFFKGVGDWIARTYPKRGAAYMVEVLVEDGIYELQPVFLRACYHQGQYPAQATLRWREGANVHWRDQH